MELEVSLGNKNGFSAVYPAAQVGHTDVVKLLLKNKLISIRRRRVN